MSLRVHLEEQVREPGSEVRGRVEWQSAVKEPESVVISLLWYTEGKGTEDITIVDQQVLENPPSGGHREFSFRLPDFPWSFSGTLVSVVWAVEASVEPNGSIDRVALVSAPGGEEIRI